MGPDEDGIKKVMEYKLASHGNNVRVTTTTRVRKLGRISARAVQRRSWASFGSSAADDLSRRLTMVSTEDIVLERRNAPGGNAEEAQSSADKTSMAQVVKGTVLMVCRTCGKKGDRWTAKCPYKDLGPQLEVVLMNRPP